MPIVWNRLTRLMLLIEFQNHSVKELARRHKVEVKTIQSELRKAKRDQQNKTVAWMDGLAVRTQNALHDQGYADCAAIRAAVKDGSIWKVPHLGSVGIARLLVWLETQP